MPHLRIGHKNVILMAMQAICSNSDKTMHLINTWNMCEATVTCACNFPRSIPKYVNALASGSLSSKCKNVALFGSTVQQPFEKGSLSENPEPLVVATSLGLCTAVFDGW